MIFVSRAILALVVLWSVSTGIAIAQDYPVKPIRFVIGPAPDVLARLVGQKLTDAWGQQVIVDRRPAAGGIIAGETAAKAPPDGYTWLLSTGAYPTLIGLYPKLPFDFVRDLAPVSLLATIPFLLVVHPSLPTKSVEDLLKLARARPGQLNYASSGNGTTAHLAGEMFKNMARINIVHVTAGTPKAVVTRIHAELLKVVALPDVRERMFNLGMEVVGSTPEQLAALVNSDIAKWGKVIKESGVRVD